MYADIKARWLAALRSGNYKQGKSYLHNRDEDTYCCLGVLCDLYVKDHPDQLVAVAVEDTSPFGKQCTKYGNPGEGQISSLPWKIQDWSGIDSQYGYIRELGVSLAVLNDEGKSFEEIAKIIEEKL